MDNEIKLQRAALYARCSTEEESQKDALKKQVQEGKDCIANNNWILIDVYVEAISGTVASKRNEYQRLLRDMRTHRFDIVVIKCLDRLMRETKEWFYFCDEMNKAGKRLYLYLDGRFFNPEEEHANLLSGIEAIMAEQYSRNLSRKINNAHRHRQESGSSVVLTSRTYGYQKINGQVIVDRDQAEAVKMMFQYCKEGYGGRLISKLLEQHGYYNLNGNPIGEATIRRILRNPLYKGVAVMNKTHYDFNRKCLIKNQKEQWIYHKNVVPAIVDASLWESANQAMNQRLKKGNFMQTDIQKKNRKSTAFSGKLICGLCQCPYYRTSRKRNQTKERVTEWKCSGYLSGGRERCENRHLTEELMLEVLGRVKKDCSRESSFQEEEIIEKTIQNLMNIFYENALQKKRLLQSRMKEMQKQQGKLLELLLEGVVEKKIYRMKHQELEQELEKIKNQIKKLEKQSEEHLNQRGKVIQGRLIDGLVQKAIVYDQLQEIDVIEVYPEHVTIHNDSLNFVVSYPLPDTPRQAREKEKERIIRFIEKNPTITVKEMAEIMDKNIKTVRRRVDELRQEKKICYVGKGGHGHWDTLKSEEISH